MLARFGTPLGGPKPSKTIEKTRFFKVFAIFQAGVKKRPKKLQKETLGRPKCPPGVPQEGPRGAKTAPGAARSAPGAPQEPPKRRHKGVKNGFALSGGLREASGSHFEAIWGRCWRLRGGILEPFLVAFSSLFLSHSRGCGLLAFRCSWLRLPPCSGRKARREAAGTHAKRVTSLARPP